MKTAAALIMVAFAAGVGAQTPPLNPTVTVLPQATMPVPADCDTTMTPQIAQPVPSPRPVPQPPVPAPPQPVEVPIAPADVRSVLREAHEAALARDRASFDAALARAKAMGGASAADREVIAVLSDVQRLWEYQFTTPAGSFFDASVQDGSLLAMLKRYPGYERAIEPQTFTSGGVRYYPVRESIVFLLGVARDRLQRSGVPMERIAEAPRRPVPAPPVPQPVISAPRTTEKTPTPAPVTKSSRRTRPRPTPTTTKRVTPAPKPAPQPVAPPRVVEDPALPIPSGVVTTREPAITTETTATTDTAPPVGETIEPIAPDTTATTAEATPAQRRGRSIIMPLVLILIGVGVLIVLFRASS